jgi:AcrR family transcriptional regulator
MTPFENGVGIDGDAKNVGSKESRFSAAYEGGLERLSGIVAAAVKGERGWPARVSSGLLAGLDFLAVNPDLARLLAVESLAPDRPARLEHERALARLARALRPPAAELPLGEAFTEETARLLAGGLASHVSGRVLAGEAERLPESHDLLLAYLLTPTSSADERRAAGS